MRNILLAALWLAAAGAQAATLISPAGGGSGGSATNAVTSINGDSTGAQLIISGSSGTDVAIATSAGTTTISLPSAAAAVRGVLSSNDWQNFNGKQAGNAVLTNLVGTVAKNVTNVVSLSTSNATSKPIVQSYSAGTVSTFGIEAGANVTVTPNGSNLVVAATGGGGGGDVSAAMNFGTDAVVIISDGVNKGVKATAIAVSPAGSITLPTDANLNLDGTGALNLDNGNINMVSGVANLASAKVTTTLQVAEEGAAGHLRATNRVITPLLQSGAISNVAFTVGDNLHVNGSNAVWRYTASTNASLVFSNLQLNTPVRLEVYPATGSADWALSLNVPAVSWPASNAWAFPTNRGRIIIEITKTSSSSTNLVFIEWPAFDTLSGWKTAFSTNWQSGQVSVVETNPVTQFPSNALAGIIDFTLTPVYQLDGTIATNASYSLSNLVARRTVNFWFRGQTNGGPVQTVHIVTNGLTSSTKILWNGNNSTNGASTFSLTNGWAVKGFLTVEGTFAGTTYISGEFGFYDE